MHMKELAPLSWLNYKLINRKCSCGKEAQLWNSNSFEKVCCKSSSSENLAAIECNVFWKSSRSKKEYCFSKKLAFSKM